MIERYIDYIIDEKFNETYETKWFENPEELKSIPDIKHYHIFAKVKEKELPT